VPLVFRPNVDFCRHSLEPLWLADRFCQAPKFNPTGTNPAGMLREKEEAMALDQRKRSERAYMSPSYISLM
jgi:hypothetical protein